MKIRGTQRGHLTAGTIGNIQKQFWLSQVEGELAVVSLVSGWGIISIAVVGKPARDRRAAEHMRVLGASRSFH